VAIAIYLVILVAAFYFLIVRPQRRQQVIRRQLIATVDVGDEIITTGGVFGTVTAMTAETLDLRIADGVVVKIARGAVAQKITERPADGLDDDGVMTIDEAEAADGHDEDDDAAS
jgi:preprotein translocase subunit YajC